MHLLALFFFLFYNSLLLQVYLSYINSLRYSLGFFHLLILIHLFHFLFLLIYYIYFLHILKIFQVLFFLLLSLHLSPNYSSFSLLFEIYSLFSFYLRNRIVINEIFLYILNIYLYQILYFENIQSIFETIFYFYL